MTRAVYFYYFFNHILLDVTPAERLRVVLTVSGGIVAHVWGLFVDFGAWDWGKLQILIIFRHKLLPWIWFSVSQFGGVPLLAAQNPRSQRIQSIELQVIAEFWTDFCCFLVFQRSLRLLIIEHWGRRDLRRQRRVLGVSGAFVGVVVGAADLSATISTNLRNLNFSWGQIRWRYGDRLLAEVLKNYFVAHAWGFFRRKNVWVY